MRAQLSDLFQRFLGRIVKPNMIAADDDAGFSATLTDSSAQGLAYLRAGKQALEGGDFAAALKDFQRVLDAGVADAEGHYGSGVAALRLGRTSEATDAFRRALEATPPHPEAGLRLAEMTLAGGDAAAALDLYRRALEAAPGLAEAHFGWGVVALGLGRRCEAAEAFRRALDAKPPHPEAGLRLAELTLADGDATAALDLYHQVLEVAPGLSAAHFGGAVAALRLGRRNEAADAFRRALDATPPHPEAGLRLAEMALGDANAAAALELYARVKETAPGVAEAHSGWTATALRLAQTKLAEGDAAAALDLYHQVLEAAPGLSAAHFGWAVAALRLGRRNEAADAFRRALDATPPHPEAGLRLAEMALADANAAAALELYARVKEAAPGVAEAHSGWTATALRLAQTKLAEGDAAAALDLYRKVREAAPDVAEAHSGWTAAALRLAQMTLAQGDASAALDIFRRVLEVAPSSAEAHLGWGLAALQLGRISEARAAFGRALDIDPGYPAAVAAMSFLSFFPFDRPLRPVKERRPLIFVPVLPFVRGWLGGQIYLLNFARIVSALPRSRRPRLLVAVMLDDWHDIPSLRDVVSGLSQCDAVVGIFDRSGKLASPSPLLDRYVRHKRRGTDSREGWTAELFGRVDWTFPMLYPAWGMATVPRPMYWIPDFQHRFWPSYFNPAEIAARDRDITALAARDAAIVFSSRDAEAHFGRFYPSEHCRTHVWHFHTLSGPTPATESGELAELHLPSRFYYTPNQFWPHKNHTTLFRALKLLVDKSHDVTFVCTGSDLAFEPDEYQRGVLALIAELDIGRHVRLLGILPRPVQLELLRRACAVIQPSLFEGWSTVIEDARAFGRPLIVSDIPVNREQADSGTVFFSPQDPDALAAAVVALDTTLKPGPDLKGERAARRSLNDQVGESAEQFLNILACETTRRPALRALGRSARPVSPVQAPRSFP
jgi:tetratricopeptide (TPR) repeat protein